MIEPDPEAAVAYGLFSVRQAKNAGHGAAEIRRRIDVGRWERLGRGILQEAGREPRHGDRYVRDVLVGGPQAVSGFSSAAAAHGWDLDVMPTTPSVILPPGIRGPGRVSVYRAMLTRDDVMLLGVLRLTTPLCTATHLACALPLLDAVVMVDCACRSRGIRLAHLEAAMAGAKGNGVVRGRKALALADPLSGSIPESLARMLFHHAGLAPISQFAIRTIEGIYRVDFAWPQAMLVVEIDGREWHIGREVFQEDRVRQNALQQAGWLVLRFTAQQVRNQPDYVIGEVLRALAR